MDVGHGRDEMDVGVQSCIVWVKGEMVLQSPAPLTAGA